MLDLLTDGVTDINGNLTASATFSRDRIYRYRLVRRWAAGPHVLFVMLNPSTAEALRDDNTVRRVTQFARAWGAAGLVVANLFGLRSTNPAALLTHPDPVGPDNDAVIAETLDLYDIGPVVAAWGDHRSARTRAGTVLELLRHHGQVLCLGTTRSGTPRHPLYLPAATVPCPFGGVL